MQAASSIQGAREILRRYWGYPAFREGQETAIEAVLRGRDILVIMPTGGGKSLCYQVPAMLLPGVTLVVSPLISLMKDQVDALEQAGLPATFINSTLSGGEMAARLDAAERGKVKLVYIAPERFDSDSFQERLSRLEVSLLAVDEAHCVSQWGHDFRPSYLRLSRARELLGRPPVAALTATATDEVRRDVVRQLDLRDPQVLVTGFDRRNLTWHVLKAKNDSQKDRLLLKLLRGRGDTAIVYASTRKSVDALTPLLNSVRVRAVGYHAGLPDAERKSIQDAFMSGAVPVVVATNAFGMGIDKPDVRLVVHYNLPGTVEAYYQEAGRAGRDGLGSQCVLLHAYQDRFTHEFFIEQNYPERRVIEGVMQDLRARADAAGMISLPIGELAQALSPRARGDRPVLSAIRLLGEYGLVRQVGGGAAQPVKLRLLATPKRITRELDGAGRTAEIELLRTLWRAAKGEAIYRGVELEWRDVAGLGGGRGRTAELLNRLQAESFLEWQAPWGGEGLEVLDRTTPVSRLPVDWRGLDARKERELRKLQRMQGYAYHERCRRGYLLRYFGDPAAMRECGACDNCLQDAPLATDDAPDPAPPRRTRRASVSSSVVASTTASPAAVPPVEAAPEPLHGEALELFERLRELRSRLAREAGLPAYCVFPDRTLQEFARRRPSSSAQLLTVSGVGPAKLEKYGEDFLRLLRGDGVV